ncbi:MAG TPA: hypothetical protein VGR30_04455 [Candidatus Binatia bacterium]|jgi:hypothetical protein|nr:hypothetical protein [Candidatus Binatia bacterium]
MSQILLIEPYKVLRQAITLFLSPDHEIKVQEDTKGLTGESLVEYDLIVVDGTALRETGQLSPEFTRALQATRAKIFWLEEDDAPPSVKKEEWVILRKPIERQTFERALTNLFSPQQVRRGPKVDALSPSNPKVERSSKRRQPEDLRQATLQFIELTDAVEEASSTKKEKKAPKKSK